MNKENTVNEEQIRSMFKVGAHFGFSKSRRHPSMAPFIFGVKNKVEIFDLEKVSDLLESTKSFFKQCGNERKKILFVGGKNEARDIIKQAARGVDMPYVAGRWIGGTITNFQEIKKRINRLSDLTSRKEKGELDKFTKLEQLHIEREIKDLDSTFGGLKSMESLPDVLFVVDSKHEEIAVSEANKKGITVVGILNSDCNTNDTDYFVAGNDSSIASIKFFVNELTESYKEGLKSAPQKKVETKKTTTSKTKLTKEK